MFSTIKNTFEINNTSRLLTLKQDLLYIKTNNGESITSYFLRISKLKDRLATIGSQVDDKELSFIALKGLPLSWETFIRGVSSRPNQLATIGSQVDDKELRIIALKGLPLSWETFIRGLISRPNLPKFELLKNECTQEESRLVSKGININQD